MGSRMRRGSYSEREGMRSRMSRLRDRATELEILINADLFDSARVIASTLVSSNHRLLNGRRFPTLFIDEAAQALEAACWIAIRKADRVILAGDHCQLPPTIKCIEAARGGLDHTLMEKSCSKNLLPFRCSKCNTGCMRQSCAFLPNGSTTGNWKPHRKCATGVFLISTLP